MGTDTMRATGIIPASLVVASATRTPAPTESSESGAGVTGLLLNLTRRGGSSGAPLDSSQTMMYTSRRIA